jgi:3-methyladenine DNA glycosylase/8-oxoguanine DNA glycosylase
MPNRFTIDVPADYVFARDLCSYGYFLLAPNKWNPAAQTLTRPLDLERGVATLTIAQPTDKPARTNGRSILRAMGEPLVVESDRSLNKSEKASATRLLGRMLSLDDAGVPDFHRLDARWTRSGPGLGRGRLSRSPTFFEDVVKTVTSCNVTWPGTVGMNRRLCEVINPAFPAPAQLARVRPSTLRARCGVGYRDARLVELGRLASRGQLDEAWFTDPANDDATVYKALLELPGVGPYAAGNIMQLLGRYSRLAIDSESVRHGRDVLGLEGTDRAIQKRLEQRYEPYGAHRFRAYWLELWAWYEERRGPAWTWDPSEVGASFTAAKFRQEASAEGTPAARARPAARPGARRAPRRRPAGKDNSR